MHLLVGRVTSNPNVRIAFFGMAAPTDAAIMLHNGVRNVGALAEQLTVADPTDHYPALIREFRTNFLIRQHPERPCCADVGSARSLLNLMAKTRLRQMSAPRA